MTVSDVVDVLRELSRTIRAQVLKTCREQSIVQLSRVRHQAPADTIFNIDPVSERVLLGGLEPHAERLGGIVLVAEGLSKEAVTLPQRWRPEQARWRVIIDPIDGVRGLMYQKRSAWVLAAVAPNRDGGARLSDVKAAVQTEIPTLKAVASDELWAFTGQAARAERYLLEPGRREPLALRPSQATSILNGHASVSRFLPGGQDELAAIDEAIIARVLALPASGKAARFEDQHASTGGQLYELIAGQHPFVADLRPLMAPLLRQRGWSLGLCCLPYDICTILIARQAGVIVTAVGGRPLDVPLDVYTEVAWVGYANAALRRQIEPVLLTTLRKRGWLA